MERGWLYSGMIGLTLSLWALIIYTFIKNRHCPPQIVAPQYNKKNEYYFTIGIIALVSASFQFLLIIISLSPHNISEYFNPEHTNNFYKTLFWANYGVMFIIMSYIKPKITTLGILYGIRFFPWGKFESLTTNNNQIVLHRKNKSWVGNLNIWTKDDLEAVRTAVLVHIESPMKEDPIG